MIRIKIVPNLLRKNYKYRLINQVTATERQREKGREKKSWKDRVRLRGRGSERENEGGERVRHNLRHRQAELCTLQIRNLAPMTKNRLLVFKIRRKIKTLHRTKKPKVRLTFEIRTKFQIKF